MHSSKNSVPTTASGKREYRVPERFSLAEGLAMLTLFGLLFNGLYFLGAPRSFFLFFGVLGMVICLVQMRFSAAPRAASMVTGIVLVVLWDVIAHWLFFDGVLLPISTRYIAFYIIATVFGAGLGYGVGTVAAGVFLVSDRITARLLSMLDDRESRSSRGHAGSNPWDHANTEDADAADDEDGGGN